MKTLILAGGSGTRLFPLSREYYPKQFLPLFDGKSMFQKTIERSLQHSISDEIFIVTNEKHKFIVKDQASEICEGCHVLVEPVAKSTLPAVYYGMKEISRKVGACNVIVLPSDHMVIDDAAYLASVKEAECLAKDYLMVFGIVPESPETGYGYIKPGSEIGSGWKVDSFVEKPDAVMASKYLKDGYLWNSGMFLFNDEVFFRECEEHAPEIVAAFTLPVAEAFDKTPAVSIDYGLMELTSHVAVVPFGASWNDMGSFKAMYDVLPKDENGNVLKSECRCLDSSGNLIISDRLVAAVDVNDTAIIDTRDVLLIAPLAQSQRVKEVVEALRENDDERTKIHTTVYRPWGSYTELEVDSGYRIKRISVPPKNRLSLQLHHHRSEHWVVVKGTARVTIGDETFLVRQGESTFVPVGEVHRLENAGIIPLEMIEVQIGEYIGEDDIVRLDDDYSRSEGV